MFIDSNIFCYYFTRSSDHHDVVATFLDDAIEDEDFQTSVVVLMEVGHYLVNHLGPVKGQEKMNQLLSVSLTVVDFDYRLLRNSMDQLARYAPQGIGGRDAAILASMKQEEIKTIITHDRAFTSVEEINVIDPVD